MSGLRKFTTKYNTPRIMQIFYTLICVAVVVLVWQGSLRASMAGAIGGYKCGSILHVFYYIFGCKHFSFFQFTIDYIYMCIGIMGIVFIWMNRAKLAAITPGVYLVTMLLTLLKKDHGDYYVKYNSYAEENIYETLSWGSEYTYAWIAVVVFVVLTIVAIFVTKKGERKAVAVRVTELPKPNVEKDSVEQTANDLVKYKELLDKGIITQEEFDVKKKQLLDL